MDSLCNNLVKSLWPPKHADVFPVWQRAEQQLPHHSVGAIIRTIMWASAFSSLLIIFMKKM